jgi:hypothetical protein
MARAYLYAEGDGPEPRELDALRAIQAFGAEAVWGRPIGVGEMRRMLVADSIVRAHIGRATHKEGWAAWAADNPEQNALLNTAMKMAGAEDG